MIQISIDYADEFRCTATHSPSGNTLHTDAPVDNNGKGETFSPTDLVAAALGNCMATIIGIVAERKDLCIKGLHLTVEKHMSTDMPRRISRLPIRIEVPISESSKYKDLIINAALTCPVHQSLHSTIEIPITWVWDA